MDDLEEQTKTLRVMHACHTSKSDRVTDGDYRQILTNNLFQTVTWGETNHCTRFALNFIGNLTKPALMDSA